MAPVLEGQGRQSEAVGALTSYTFGNVTADHTIIASCTPAVPLSSFMTDSDFNPITSIDVLFTPDKAGNSMKLTATNPGTYYHKHAARDHDGH